jgi:LysR family transcriptional activator of nhaA
MSLAFGYRHLYYFWVVAQEGGIARAAARLGIAVQTVSTQVNELERSLGAALLKPAGRGVALTDAGVAAMKQAQEIFRLGEALPAIVRDAVGSPVVRLVAGVSDGLAKLVVRHLMQPVIGAPGTRLAFHEGRFDDLLAGLALHRLDVVLADRPAPAHPNFKLYTHALGTSELAWYAAPSLYAAARRGFPRSLASVPVLLPTSQSATRMKLDAWFERHDLRPAIAGEFEDSALMKTFAASGAGVFASPTLVHQELMRRFGVRRIGPCEGVGESWYALGAERNVHHPLVLKILR